MEPIFLSWKEFPEYSLPVARHERLGLTSDEEKYSDSQALSPEQAKWACFTKKNQCHDSWEKFHQEYPGAADLAFCSQACRGSITKRFEIFYSLFVGRLFAVATSSSQDAGSAQPEFVEDPADRCWCGSLLRSASPTAWAWMWEKSWRGLQRNSSDLQ